MTGNKLKTNGRLGDDTGFTGTQIQPMTKENDTLRYGAAEMGDMPYEQ